MYASRFQYAGRDHAAITTGTVDNCILWIVKHGHQLPSAIGEFDLIHKKIIGRRPILCLDYDGTLTPIVADHDKAIISDRMRRTVQALAQSIPVAIITGRDVPFVQKHMRLPEAFYAGSHGFEIIGPGGYRFELKEAEEIMPELDRLETGLRELTSMIPGAEIERKKYAMAVHYRKVDEADRPKVRGMIERLLEGNDRVRTGEGKMLVELKPAIDWHKGKALATIVAKLDPSAVAIAIFIGDDVTDEDAFNELKGNGIGIYVGDPSGSTAATFHLKDVGEVEEFLNRLQGSLSHQRTAR